MRIGEKELSRLPPHLQRLFVKVYSGSPEVLAGFPETGRADNRPKKLHPRSRSATAKIYGEDHRTEPTPTYGDIGSAARFFYSAKADTDDRLGSRHPTVKPVDLMRWLVRLVTPPKGLVLDPFAGTGTTGHAALIEGMRAVLIEREPEYQDDIARRMDLVFAGQDERRGRTTKQDAHESMPLFGGSE